MQISWSQEKDELLSEIRGVSFTLVKTEIEAGRFVGPELNPSRPGQYRIIVRLNAYPHVVPLVIDQSGDWFLKTIIPSRKAKKAGLI
ncbi:MAG: toxin [Spirochaetales bacterium]|nr:toxin [Spirochaetales bacterium]